MDKKTETRTWVVNAQVEEGNRPTPIDNSGFEEFLQVARRPGGSVDFSLGRGGVAEAARLEVAANDVVEVELEDGLKLYLSAQRLESLGIARSIEDGNTFRITGDWPIEGPRDRGLGKLIFKALHLLDVDSKIADKSASAIAAKLEDKLIGGGGLYRWDREQGSWSETPVDGETRFENGPILIFIHGTASTTEGSFSALWSQQGSVEWQQLLDHYGSNIFAFEHRTLSESPIENAVQLMHSLQNLPEGSALHMVSHSRGGLVGELLCRGERLGASPFDEQDYALFDPAKNARLKRQLENTNNQAEAKAANARQVEQLKKLDALLAAKRFRIERFLRVACPVRGTTLASARLDVYLSGLLNLFGLVSGMRANPVYHFLQTVVIALARERADPASLPGLEAMMPLSTTIHMLNSSQQKTASHLAVIAGDIEARGIFRKLAIFLMDRFYQGEHDLVVDTEAMEGGTLRAHSAVMSEQGDKVNHFSYFRNSRSRKALTAALVEPTLPGEFELRLPDKPVPRYITRSATPREMPTVIIVPGISGSNLAAEDDRIWLSLRLVFGGFEKLRYQGRNDDRVKPDGVIGRYYDDLAEYLARSHNVVCFDYDWRKSIIEAADGLAQEMEKALDNSPHPVRIVAHSMGGLVSRAMMTRHTALWQRMTQRNGSHLLMLGTPLQGSYSITRLLTGEESLTGMLSLLDLAHDESQWLDILRKFPGVLELLPRHGEMNFYEKKTWEIFLPFLNRKKDDNFFSGLLGPVESWKPPLQKALKEADETWGIIDGAVLDSRFVQYVAGHARETPIGVEISSGKIEFIGTQRGDGRVPWKFGIPEGISHWYMNAEHGALANTHEAFPAIRELIETGTTDKLSRSEPGWLSRSLGEQFVMTRAQLSHLPSEEEIGDALMGVSSHRRKVVQPVPSIHLSVSHGDLAFATGPVIVGHYKDDAIVNAEAALDRQLNGRLSSRFSLGLYPGLPGSNEVLLNESYRQLKGAVVIGLGQIGSLTPGGLRTSFRDGVLKYTLTCAELPRLADKPVQLSSLLVGSSDSGIPLEDAIRAMVLGAMEANETIRRQTGGSGKVLESLEFIEIYEEEASLAQKILLRMEKNRQLGSAIDVEPFLCEKEGGFSRLAADDTSWWERLSIRADEDGALVFNFLSKRARAESELIATQRRIVDGFIEQATRQTGSDIKTAQALYELLVPHEFKSHALDNRNMLLILDEQSAIYPWELLEYRDDAHSLAPAAEAGMIRQLITEQYLQHPAVNRNNKALVVGDPPSFAPELPGAQQEATLVQKKLSDNKFNTTALIRKSGLEIIAALMSDDYQILHLAGHGVFNFVPDTRQRPPRTRSECVQQCEKRPEPVTGMILGDGMFLTPAEIAQMPTTPELVFINCCFLGKADDYRDLLSGARHRLAANVATQLIRNGVIAVVAAGWAVDDDAASLFADVFYDAMLNGRNFGDAVQEARRVCKSRYPHSNTWGAYQCYGDPNYRLCSGVSGPLSELHQQSFVSRREAVVKLKNIIARARVANQVQNASILEELESLRKSIPDAWMDDAELLSALGEAYGELEMFAEAVNYYRKALRSEKTEVSISSVEQLANFEARLSLQKSLQSDDKEALALIKASINRLELINELCTYESGIGDALLDNTVERLCLLGSCYKRKAMISHGAKREGDLQNMYKFYEDADNKYFAKYQKINSYPRLGWLSAWWVLSRLSREKRYRNLDEAKGKLIEAREDFEQRSHVYEDYWLAMTCIEFDLLQALMDNNLQEHWENLLQRYRDQFRIASSPRQISSSLDTLRFYSTMLAEMPQADRKLRQQLDKLLQALEKGAA
jgi:CHAT domain-containing protein/pimeloyl-ACP methyl ester carboxylesterase